MQKTENIPQKEKENKKQIVENKKRGDRVGCA
jgi:hypothetical protein